MFFFLELLRKISGKRRRESKIIVCPEVMAVYFFPDVFKLRIIVAQATTFVVN